MKEEDKVFQFEVDEEENKTRKNAHLFDQRAQKLNVVNSNTDQLAEEGDFVKDPTWIVISPISVLGMCLLFVVAYHNNHDVFAALTASEVNNFQGSSGAKFFALLFPALNMAMGHLIFTNVPRTVKNQWGKTRSGVKQFSAYLTFTLLMIALLIISVLSTGAGGMYMFQILILSLVEITVGAVLLRKVSIVFAYRFLRLRARALIRGLNKFSKRCFESFKAYREKFKSAGLPQESFMSRNPMVENAIKWYTGEAISWQAEHISTTQNSQEQQPSEGKQDDDDLETFINDNIKL